MIVRFVTAQQLCELGPSAGQAMKVSIKRFNVTMDVKNSGIEFEVRSPNGKDHLGDLVLNKSKLIWCPGATRPANGHQITWKDFIDWASTK